METAAVAWAREVLAPDRVTWIRTRPWAEVWRLDTADDRYWLKINFRRTVYEPRLLELLQRTGADLLPPLHRARLATLGADPRRRAVGSGGTRRRRAGHPDRLLVPGAGRVRGAATSQPPAGPDGRRSARLLRRAVAGPLRRGARRTRLAGPGARAGAGRGAHRTDPGLPAAARRRRAAARGRSAADRAARRPARRQRVHPRRPDHAHRLGRRGVRPPVRHAAGDARGVGRPARGGPRRPTAAPGDRRLSRGVAYRRRVGGRTRSTARPGAPDRRRSVVRRAGSARSATPRSRSSTTSAMPWRTGCSGWRMHSTESG